MIFRRNIFAAASASDPPNASRYWAFISYSHADATWGRWLHRSLETFRVPWGLVGKRTAKCTVPRRIFPVFRDQDELASSNSLSAEILSALSQSYSMIVICSARSAASHWVNEEIRAFKAHGHAERIFCLITDGEPNASDRPELGLLECFPRAVRYAISPQGKYLTERSEPLAADARPGKDARSVVRLRLVAGLLGIAYDDLRRRDVRRRFWRRMIGLVVFLAFAGVLSSVWYRGHLEAAAIERGRNLRLAQLMVQKATAAQERADGNSAVLYGAYSILYSIRAGGLAPGGSLPSAKAHELDFLRSLTIGVLPGPSLSETAFSGALAASRDGKLLAWGRADGTVTIWDAHQMRTLEVLPADTGKVNAMAFAPDDSTLATAGEDGALRLWSTADGRQAALLDQGLRPLRTVAFSADGKLLAAAGDAAGISVWDLADRKRAYTLDENDDRINAVAFSPGGLLVSASQDLVLRLWAPATATEAKPALAYSEPPRSVAFSRDGALLAVGLFDGTVRLVDLASWSEVAVLKGHGRSVETLAFSPDSRLLASGSGDWTVALWEICARDRVATLPGHGRPITGVAFVGDDGLLITGSEEDHVLRLWRAAPQTYAAAVAAHQGPVRAVAFHPGGKFIATAGDDRQIRLWDATTLQQIEPAFPPSHSDAIRALAFSPDGARLVSAGRDGKIIMWDWAARKMIAPPGARPQHDSWIFGVAYSPKGDVIASASWDGLVKLWRDPDLLFLGEFEEKQPVGGVAFSPDGSLLASAANDHLAKLWSPAAVGKNPATPLATLIGHTEVVRPIAFSPDGKMLATGSGDASIKFWVVADCLVAARCSPTDSLIGHYAYMVWALAFSPDGSLLASGSESHDRQTVRLWDVAGRKLIAFLTGHRGFALALAFSPDGRSLASGGTDGTLRLWKVNDFVPGGGLYNDAKPPLFDFLSTAPFTEDRAIELIRKVGKITGLEMVGTDTIPAKAPTAGAP